MMRRRRRTPPRSFEVLLGAVPSAQAGASWAGGTAVARYLQAGGVFLEGADGLWFHNFFGCPIDILLDEAAIGTGLPYGPEPAHANWRALMEPDNPTPGANTGERGFMAWGDFIALARAARPGIKIGIDVQMLNAARTGAAEDPWADGTPVAFDFTSAVHRAAYVRWVRHLYDALQPDYLCYGVEFASDFDPDGLAPDFDTWIQSRARLMQDCYYELRTEAAAGLLCGPSIYVERWRKNYLANGAAAAVLGVVGGAWMNDADDASLNPLAGLGNCFFLSDHQQAALAEAGDNMWTDWEAPNPDRLMDLDQIGLADIYNRDSTAGVGGDNKAHVVVSEASAWDLAYSGTTHRDQSAMWRCYEALAARANLRAVHYIATEDPAAAYADQHGLASFGAWGSDPTANFNVGRGKATGAGAVLKGEGWFTMRRLLARGLFPA